MKPTMTTTTTRVEQDVNRNGWARLVPPFTPLGYYPHAQVLTALAKRNEQKGWATRCK
jgi:hypothetical protein